MHQRATQWVVQWSVYSFPAPQVLTSALTMRLV
jgi:hypothetical protein